MGGGLEQATMRGHRSPTQPVGSRSGTFMQQPRSRRETFFLLGIVAIAGFFIWRLCQYGTNAQQGNTFTAVLSTTQVRRSSGRTRGQILRDGM